MAAISFWRLDESPHADFAELFTFMYITQWLKPICEIYAPGVWFDFMVDDWILTKMNNLTTAESDQYIESEQRVLDFLKPYQPSNMNITATRCSTLYTSEPDFWHAVDNAMLTTPIPVMTDQQKAMVELNVRPSPGYDKDPMWREKIFHLHNAYLVAKGEEKYHKNNPEKIGVFTTVLGIPGYMAVGTTKNSIMKFWVGVGVLKPRGDDFEMTIMSGNQLKTAKFEFQNVSLPDLDDPNFSRIRVIIP